VENRQGKRVSLRADVSIKAEGLGVIHGWIKDVSITGVHIKTDEFLPIGTPCIATLVIREDDVRRRIQVDAKVMRHDAKGMGIHFTSMSDKVRADLSAVLLYNQALPH